MTAEAFKWDPVKAIYNETEILCTWFVEQERNSEYFNEAVIIKGSNRVSKNTITKLKLYPPLYWLCFLAFLLQNIYPKRRSK